MNKTIVFFNSNKAWGGGEKWHLTTCKEFARRGFKTILISNYHSQLAVKGIQEKQDVYRFRISNFSFLNPFKIFVFFLFFKVKKVDAVILNLPADLKVAGIAAKLAGVPKIIYRRGMPHPLRNTALNRFLFTKILTHVVVNSKEIGRSLKEGNESWFPEEKMVLIYNGIDTSKPVDKTKKMFEKQGDEIIIGNAGRLTEQKGQKYLVELAKLLKADGMNFKILIAGEGELRGALQKMIEEAGVQDQVKLIGHVDDMTAFYNSLDVFVFTSLYEGSANTLIEVLWHGVPTLAWDVSSNPEVIFDDDLGLLVKSFDTFAMKDAIAKVLLQRKEQSNNITIVKSKFDSSSNLDILSSLVQSKIK